MADSRVRGEPDRAGPGWVRQSVGGDGRATVDVEALKRLVLRETVEVLRDPTRAMAVILRYFGRVKTIRRCTHSMVTRQQHFTPSQIRSCLNETKLAVDGHLNSHENTETLRSDVKDGCR